MATPKTEVLIDFNEDGDFRDSDEDVSSNVRQIDFAGGQIPVKHRVDSSLLSFILKNDDHIYSPSKSTTKFNRVKLSPNVWWLMGYPNDDFNASNGTDLASRKPSHDSLFDAWSGDTSDFTVLSNKARTSVAANKTAVLDFGEKFGFVGVKYTRGGTTSGLILRYTDASNFLMVYHDGTSIRLGEVVSGTLTSLASATFTWATGDEKRILCELHGNDIRVSVDNAFQFSHTTTRFNTVTKHGIGGRATHVNDRWDDFGGWRSMFFGRIDTVQPRPIHARQYAFFRCLDDLERMSKHLVYRRAPAVPATAKDIIDEILNGANFSTANRILDTGETLTIDEFSRNAMGRDARTELFQVADDDVGLAFIDGNGYARYEANVHRIPNTNASYHNTVLATWFASTPNGLTTEIYFQDLLWDDGKDRVENEIYYRFHKINLSVAAQVYRLHEDDVPQILNDQTLTILVVGAGDVIVDPRPPIHTIDFLLVSTTVAASQSGTVSATGSAQFRLDDTGATFTSTIRDGNHTIVIKDASGFIAKGVIGTSDVDGDDTRVEIFTDDGLGTLGYSIVSDSFSETDTPLTYSVHADLMEEEDSNQGTVAASGSSAFTLDDTGQNFVAGDNKKSWTDGKHMVRITDNSGTRATAFIGTSDVDGDGTKVQLYTDKDRGTLGYIWTEKGWSESDTPLTYAIFNVTSELVTGFDGNFRQVRIINNSGSTGRLEFLQLFGEKGVKAIESMARAEHTVSQDNIGRRRVEHTTLHIDKFTHQNLSPTTVGGAQERAKARLGARSLPREVVKVDMTNATRANMMQIIHRSMSDMVTLNFSDMGINDKYFIERKTISMNEGNTLVECTWELTAAVDWLFGADTNAARYDEALFR